MDKKTFRILSIDGGGVRGIMPARILQTIEEVSGAPIHELFDLIVGTSTGGLVALALVCPGLNGLPKYSAKDIVNIYLQYAPKIFHRSLWRTITTGGGLWSAKYTSDAYDAILKDLFADVRLSQALCPVALPTYSLLNGLPNIFTSRQSIDNKVEFFMRDIAGATSAAPTYFPPKHFTDNFGNQHIEVDGVIFADNPESIGISEAYKLSPGLERQNIYLLSLGTGAPKLSCAASSLGAGGVINWVLKANLIDIMIDADNSWYNEDTADIYPNAQRMQITIEKSLGKMDNASPDNLHLLAETAEQFVQANEQQLKEIAKVYQNI